MRHTIEVPILENGCGNDICGFFSVFHLTHFSRNSLKNCLRQAGWLISEWHEMDDYNGCRVICEPCTESSEIIDSQQDNVFLHQYLSTWHQAIAKVSSKLDSIKGHKHIVIWGGGGHTEFLYHITTFFHSNHNKKYTIVDSDPLKQGKSWRGIPILKPSFLTEIDWSQVFMVVSSYGGQESIVNEAKSMGITTDKIITLYDEISIH